MGMFVKELLPQKCVFKFVVFKMNRLFGGEHVEWGLLRCVSKPICCRNGYACITFVWALRPWGQALTHHKSARTTHFFFQRTTGMASGSRFLAYRECLPHTSSKEKASAETKANVCHMNFSRGEKEGESTGSTVFLKIQAASWICNRHTKLQVSKNPTTQCDGQVFTQYSLTRLLL